MMTYKRLFWATCLAGLHGLPLTASAATGSLSTFVDDTKGASQAQINAGNAIQSMCTYLSTTDGFSTASPQSKLATAQGDLFLRCNELVQSARQLLGQAGATSRSLGVGTAGLLGAVQQVSGEEVAAQGTLASQVPSGQFANITSRINALRYGYAGVSMRGRVTALSSSSNDSDAMTDTFHESYPLAQLAQFSRYANDDSDDAQVRLRRAAYVYSGDAAQGAAMPVVLATNPWGLFTEGTYNFGHRDESPEDDAFHFHSESVTAGVDYNFGRGVLGVSAGYDYYKADFIANGVTVSGGDTRVEGTTGSVFGAWFGEKWNFSGIASYGSLNSDVTRVVSYSPTANSCTSPTLPSCGATRTLRGTPDGKDFAVGVNAGYDLHAGLLLVTPNWAVNYRHIKIDGYGETDLTSPTGGSGLPLAYDDQSIDSLRSVLGFDAVLPVSRSFGVVSPSFHAEWDHEFRNSARDVSVRYSADPSYTGNSATCASCFVIPTERPDADFGVVGVGLTALFSNRLQASLSYERLVGVSYLTSNSITLQVRGQL